MTKTRFKQTALAALDSYKLGHPDQYPLGITKVSSNFTPRSEKYFSVPTEYKRGKIVWYGALQSFLQDLKDIWQETFFDVPFEEIEAEAQDLYVPFCGPNGYNTKRLKELWDLGYLPLEIKALAEGSHVNIGIPVLVITNTRDEQYWLPNSLETWLSFDLWRPATSASISFVYRKIIEKYAKVTGGNKDFILWQGHDFSPRGMGGFYDAARSGSGHLTSFFGTDNIPAAKLIKQVYGGCIYGSVPATEHAVMCAGGKESELETFKRLLTTYPNGIVSIVSDTWNFWNVIGGSNSLAAQLKDQITSRGEDAFGNSKTVFRPDSGDPVKIICGYKTYDRDAETSYGKPYWDLYYEGYEAIKLSGKFYVLDYTYGSYDDVVDGYTNTRELSEYEVKGAVECLADIFGTTTNAEGFKTLSKYVGLIYGDSITPTRAETILQQLAEKNFASDNVVFGIGSFTYQYQTRDTLGFAMKATYIVKDGVGEAIFKDPITDDGVKKSAVGLLRVDKQEDGNFVLTQNCTPEQAEGGALVPVFRDGNILLDENFETIRARVAEGL